MITREQAQAAIGQKAVYLRPDVTSDGYGPGGYPIVREEGVITSVNNRGAFVRYGADYGAKLTRFEDLELVSAVPDPDSSSHFICDSRVKLEGAGASHLDNLTHHLVGGRCRYCGRSDSDIRRTEDSL